MFQQIAIFLLLFIAVFYLARRSYLKYVKNKKSCESCAFHAESKSH
ncbi:MAG: hypothetical protein ACPG9L_00705 [Crocinitomicaceae bacterium]